MLFIKRAFASGSSREDNTEYGQEQNGELAAGAGYLCAAQ
jgi:hypothetical protein